MNKTLKIVLIVVVVLVGLAVAGFYGYKAYFSKDKSQSQEAEKTTPNQTEAEKINPTVVFSIYNPNQVGGKYQLTNYKFDTTTNLLTDDILQLDLPNVSSGSESVYANDSIQWSKDGKTFAYATGDEGGMDAPAVANSFKLHLVRDGVETIVVKDLEVAQVPKWLLSPTATKIYFLKGSSASEGATFALIAYDIQAKTEKTLVPDVEYFRNGGPLMLSADNGKLIIVASNQNNKVYSLEYDLTNSTSKKEELLVGVNTSQAFMGSFSATDLSISPDLNYVAYRTKVSETRHGISLYSLKDKTSKQIFVPDEKKSINDVVWSPDSGNIAFETTYFGTGDGTAETQAIYSINIATETKAKIVEGTGGNSGTGFLKVLTWSPDGKYIAYTQSKKIKIYNVGTKNISEIFSTDMETLNLKALSWIGF